MYSTVVFWSARNLVHWANPFGNHHFVLILTQTIIPGGIQLQKHKDLSFLTLGTFNINGYLAFEANNATDVQSVKDKIDSPGVIQPEPNMDFQGNRVNPPNGCDFMFAEQLISLSLKFEQNTKTSPIPYGFFGDNCAAWVNTLFKVAEVSPTERLKAGKFWGIDAGEQILLPKEMFTTRS